MKVFETPKFNHPNFNFFLRRSTYVHILLVLSTLISGKIVFDIQQKVRDKNLELIQASVRVDMVAMPSQTINELKNLSSGVEEAKPEEKALEATPEQPKVEDPAAKVAEKPDTGPSFEEVQAKKRQEFLSKLKTLGNKKIVSKGEQKTEKGLNGEKETALKNLVLSGNKLSKGTQFTGDGGGQDLTAFQAYASTLPDRVRGHWKLPQFLMDKNLKCRIRVWLSMNGEVSRTQVYQTSGDSEYDQRAIEAIKAASPFPPLKEDFAKRAQDGQILLGFPL